MAVAGVRIRILNDFKPVIDELGRIFPPKYAANELARILRKAVAPMVNRLRQITPVGPTGNLKRAVSSKVIPYRADGTALALVGYTRAGRRDSASAAGGSVRAGPDRAFHQWWLEYGTKERKITTPKRRQYQRRSPTKPFARRRNGQYELVMGKGVLHTVTEKTETYIASSFNSLGPFRMIRQGGGDGRVQTDPPYPNAFFKKSKTPIQIPATPAGGVAGRPPLNTAFMETQEQIATVLQEELSLTLAEAWAALRYKDSGTVSGTDSL